MGHGTVYPDRHEGYGCDASGLPGMSRQAARVQEV